MYKISHSRVETFKDCPYKYKLRYLDKLDVIKNQDPINPLYLGHGIHIGIEKGLDEGIKDYYSNYYLINDSNVDEVIKYECLIPKIRSRLNLKNVNHKFEFELNDESFIGFIDLLVDNEDGTVDMFDFKYSNNVLKYKDSAQLHLYKYYFEKQTGVEVRNMYFLFIPKVFAKIRKHETQFEYRQRIIETIKEKDLQLVKIDYDEYKVINFLQNAITMITTNEFSKIGSYCSWCEYEGYCKRGETIEMLPSIERVDIKLNNYKKIWMYGAPFTGKTTLADQAPTPINLNTDGNVKYVTMPRIHIKDVVKQNGRLTEKTMAWEVFKNAIDDLEKGSDFETIVVDLLEDTYEYCRLYMYDKLGITHESDDSFRAWDKVRTEFLSTIKRLMNLDYNIILISHEDTTKDITKKSGDKITAIQPNIQDKVAKKVAGMVDIVIRVVAEDDGSRTINLKSNEVIFGGGRLKNINTIQADLSWDSIEKIYEDSLDYKNVGSKEDVWTVQDTRVTDNLNNKTSEDEIESDTNVGELEEEKPRKRTRRTRKSREEE